MSEATAQSLPEGYLDLILACFEEGDEWYMSEPLYEWNEQSRKDCENNGVIFNTIEDREAWVERVQPIYEEEAAKDPAIAAFIDKALSLQ